MDDREARRVESDPAGGVRARAVLAVAGDGMADLLHVRADLVLPPRLDGELERSVRRSGLEDPVVRHAELAGLISGGADATVRVVLEAAPDGPLRLGGGALDEGVIGLLEKVAVRVVPDLRRDVPPESEEDKSRDVPVEPVARVDGSAAPLLREVSRDH